MITIRRNIDRTGESNLLFVIFDMRILNLDDRSVPS